MWSCAALAQLISGDVSLLMAGVRRGEDGNGRTEGGGVTVMGCGRCWTMTETKERF